MLKETQYARLRARLKIDQLALGEELMEHPALLQETIEHVADVMQLRDACKSALEIEMARTVKRLRADSEEKLSDAKATSEAQLEKVVQEATMEHEDAKHDTVIWQGLADSMRERGSALKRIAELTVAGYLAPNAAYASSRDEMAGKRVPLKKRE